MGSAPETRLTPHAEFQPARSSEGDDRVCAIFITHHPGADFAENVAAVRPQVAQVIVIDNGSNARERAVLASLVARPGVEVIFNDENRGIGRAINQGAAWATAAGFRWFATFDQDSRVPDGYVDALRQAYRRFPRRERVVIVSPLYLDRNLRTTSSPSETLKDDRADTPVSVTASSGNLVFAPAFAQLGGLRADLFIDCVDFEFCLRARRAGWIVLEARSVSLEHAVGRAYRRRWMGRDAVVNDYGAARRYYQARNRLIVYARFALFDPRWIARDALHYASDLVKMLLFATDRPKKLRAVLLGYWHAVTGRRGAWRE